MLSKIELIRKTYDPLSNNELLMYHLFKSHTVVSFKKNDIILKKNQIMDAYYIIESGYMRSTVENFDNEEVTIEFFKSDDIAFDVVSLFQNTPSQITLEAITDVRCLKLSFNEFLNFYQQYPDFSEWGRNWMTSAYLKLRKRTISMATHTAMYRYLEFITEMPEIHKDVPLKHIASFLGVTDTSLSRLRRSKMLYSANRQSQL